VVGLVLLAILFVACVIAVSLAKLWQWWEERDEERRAQAQRDAQDFARYRAGLDRIE